MNQAFFSSSTDAPTPRPDSQSGGLVGRIKPRLGGRGDMNTQRLAESLKDHVTWVSPCDSMTLVCADCLSILPLLEEGSVDAVVTDPPYNVGFKYAGDESGDKRDDYREWCAAWFAELERICDGAITISCGNVNLPMWNGIKPCHWTLCWWKPAAMGRSPVGFCNWEPMPMWGKPKSRKGCDVIRATIKPDPDLAGHPCPKPLAWGVGFVELLTKHGMAVLDPFTGSGTTGVACVNTGRRFIGIEKERKYFDIAVGRIEKALAEKAERLFEQEAVA